MNGSLHTVKHSIICSYCLAWRRCLLCWCVQPLLMMFSLFIQVGILSSGIFTDLSYLVVSEPAVYVDGSKGLKRDPRLAIAYANFRAHNFSRLDLIPLVSTTVKEIRECAKLCVDHLSCFSFNCAAFRNNVERKILCQLLQSDKYRESNMFASSPVFHHFSIKVSKYESPIFWVIEFSTVKWDVQIAWKEFIF